jgi:hypothetical protein
MLLINLHRCGSRFVAVISTFLTAACVLVCTSSAWGVNYNDVAGGDWSNVATWGAGPPAGSSADNVTIDTGNVTYDLAAAGPPAANNVTVSGGGRSLTLAKNISLQPSGQLLVNGGGTLNLAGFNASAHNVEINNATLNRAGGSFTVNNQLYFRFFNGSVQNLSASDTMGRLQLFAGAQVVTAANTNITTTIETGDTNTKLTLGATESITGTARFNNGATLATNGFNLSANQIEFQGGTLDRTGGGTVNAAGMLYFRGPITPTNLAAGDSSATLQLFAGAQVTTAGTGNITQAIIIGDPNTKLTLGANASITGNVTMGGGGGPGTILDLGPYSLSASTINSGRDIINAAAGSALTATSTFNFGNGGTLSQLNVVQSAADLTGLTVTTPTWNLFNNATISLTFDSTETPGFDWALRWLGDHQTQFTTWNTNGNLVWNTPSFMTPAISFDGTYTYVGALVEAQAPEGVPEPSAYALGLIGLAGLGFVVWRRRK